MEFNKPHILELSGNLKDKYCVFTESFKKYLIATETDKKCNAIQVTSLKNLMGSEALKLYNTLKSVDDEQETVSYILQVLGNYCTSGNSDLVQMYTFFTRKQQPEETFKKYYSELKNLIQSCHFGNLEENLLRVQIVLNLQNRMVQEKILKEDMCLESILSYCESEELARNKELLEMEEVDSNRRSRPLKKIRKCMKVRNDDENTISDKSSCSKCLYHASNCPAKGRKCSHCKKPNRYIGSKSRKLDTKTFTCICLAIKEEGEAIEEIDGESHCASLSATESDPFEMPEPRKTFSCDECGKTYNDPRNLVRHKRLHSGELPFVCEFCSKGFTDRGDLNKHVRYHTGEKNYECNLCLKKFFRNHDLQNHLRTHTGEKPWVCEVCAKTFITHATLNIHRRSHTGEKRYECDICHKRFAQLTDVKRHRRLHTDERPYECQICSRRFNENSQLKRHLTTHRK